MGKKQINNRSRTVLTAQVTTIVEISGEQYSKQKISRAFISDRNTGALLEPMIAFIDSNFGISPPNTQIAILRDLAFWHEWTLLKSERDETWISPERRILQHRTPLSNREVQDFARWCQRSAPMLVKARHLQSNGRSVRAIPTGTSVDNSTMNRKLEYVREYLVWLVESLIPESSDAADKDFQPGSVVVHKLRKEFSKHLGSEAKYIPPASLKREQVKELRSLVNAPPGNPFERRDRLIIRLLLEGVRVGELLKIRTYDVSERTEIDNGEYCATVTIKRCPNDIEDDRVREPAVKTLSGVLPIEARLARDLISYVIEDRSQAIERIQYGPDHSFLLVSQEGPTIGQPLSQRSINRIVAKYKGMGQIPTDLAPHKLRHTHMTEVEEILAKKGASEGTRRDTLISRGRWGRNSTMPSHYTAREHTRQSAAFVSQRDQIIYSHE